jgi:hypothetical protein
MDTKEICLCHCHGLKEACEGHTPGKCLVVCEHCCPVPSQLSRSGFELDNGTSGTVANTHYPPEVRHEKIDRIVKEFRETFWYLLKDRPHTHKTIEEPNEVDHCRCQNGEGLLVEAWLTQTLTTLLNEE